MILRGAEWGNLGLGCGDPISRAGPRMGEAEAVSKSYSFVNPSRPAGHMADPRKCLDLTKKIKPHSPQALLLRSIFFRTVSQVLVIRNDSGQRVTMRLNIS
jgi:hypothetical protein